MYGFETITKNTMNFKIRPLTCLDYRQIHDIFTSLFIKTESGKFHDAWRWRTKSLSVGIYKNKDLVGFALVKGCQLAYIGIHPLWQAFGLGSTLLRAVLTAAFANGQNIYLTPVNDRRIIQWYTKNGFQLCHSGPSDTPDVPYLIYNAHKYPTRSKV